MLLLASTSLLRGASGGVLVRRSEAVGPRRRLAAAPGRLARPAPPGHDDPCGVSRTIPEGMPRLPREAFERGFRRVVPSRSSALADLPAEASAKAKPTVASAKVGG